MRVVHRDELDFGPEPGITGFRKADVLDSHEGSVRFWQVPAGWNIGELGIAENLHFHRRVYEYAAVLAGDFPHIEYDVDRHALEAIRFVPGDLMIRPPGSLHGLKADLRVHQACDLLYWNTGPGTGILDPDYSTETIDVTSLAGAARPATAAPCRITRVDTDGAGPVGGSATMSRAAEPYQVRLRWLPAGSRLPLAELIGDAALFTFLWRGQAELGAACSGLRTSLAAWTVLAGVPEGGQCEVTLTSVAASCWLLVSRPPSTPPRLRES